MDTLSLLSFVTPRLDYHALAPEIVLTIGICVVLLADLLLDVERKWVVGNLASFALLAALVPVISLPVFGDDER